MSDAQAAERAALQEHNTHILERDLAKARNVIRLLQAECDSYLRMANMRDPDSTAFLALRESLVEKDAEIAEKDAALKVAGKRIEALEAEVKRLSSKAGNGAQEGG